MLGLGLTLMGGLVVPGATYEATEVYYPAHSVPFPSTSETTRFFALSVNPDATTMPHITRAANWRLYFRAENIRKQAKRHSVAAAGFRTLPAFGIAAEPSLTFTLAAKYGSTEEAWSSVLSYSGYTTWYSSGTEILEMDYIAVSVQQNTACVLNSHTPALKGTLSSKGTIGRVTDGTTSISTLDLYGAAFSNAAHDFCGSATQNIAVAEWRRFVVPMRTLTSQAALYEPNIQAIAGL